MDPLGQHASCVLGHCAENNLCRPPHAVGRHNMPAAPTSTHIQGVFDFSGTELGQTAVPPVSCGLSFSLPFPQQPPPLLFFSSHTPNSLACFFTWTSKQAGGVPLPAPPSPRTSSQPHGRHSLAPPLQSSAAPLLLHAAAPHPYSVAGQQQASALPPSS
jgi:hypothetical protein